MKSVAAGTQMVAQTDTAPLWRLVSRHAKPVVAINDRGTGLPFFCVHSVAGDIQGYHELSRLLGPTQRFYGIQVPLMSMTPEFASSVENMAAHYVDALISLHPVGPFAVGGFSAGAIIALEIAQQLRARGREVPLLVALDGAPNNTGTELKRGDPRYIWNVLCNIPRWVGSEEWHDWAPRHIASRLFNRFIFRPGPISSKLKAAPTTHLDAVLGVLDRPEWQSGQRLFIHALFNAICAYVPKSYDGRVLVYETQAKPLFHLMQIKPVWSKLAPGSEFIPLPGKHQSFFRGTTTLAPLAADLAPKLKIAAIDPGSWG